jgi:hypothetical protein
LLASFPHFVLLLLLLHLKNSPSPAYFWAPSMLLLLPSFLPSSCLPLRGFSSPASRGREREKRDDGTARAAHCKGVRGHLRGYRNRDPRGCQGTLPRLGCSSANVLTRRTLLNPFEPFSLGLFGTLLHLLVPSSAHFFFLIINFFAPKKSGS